jgi:ergothioneine biosynthesis protein EgtB
MTTIVCPSVSRDAAAARSEAASLVDLYASVRHATERLCRPLSPEDYLLQSMPEASPVKWHLAHTTWFFETFVLEANVPNYRPFHAEFRYLFNSYYEAVGPRWPQPRRGLLARPSIAEVYGYRAHVDEQMTRLLESDNGREPNGLRSLVVLGTQHEQQHQELIITDLKHAWGANQLRALYCQPAVSDCEPPTNGWVAFPEQLAWIGHHGDDFAFDNESPRHRVFVDGFELACRPVTNADFLAFIGDRGYQRPELWLSDGWAARQSAGWTAPLYWQQTDGAWSAWTLAGERLIEPAEPVCHINYYEADAFARWAGARLPTEAEWEIAAAGIPIAGHFQEAGRFHPSAGPAVDDGGPVLQLYGDIWQWTASPYVGYPGYRPATGALGEYNGKFMCNQVVLRGASCATPRSHARRSYRNFFRPDARWQFAGLRLARDLT